MEKFFVTIYKELLLTDMMSGGKLPGSFRKYLVMYKSAFMTAMVGKLEKSIFDYLTNNYVGDGFPMPSIEEVETFLDSGLMFVSQSAKFQPARKEEILEVK